jgi:two-component system heavy metal sensor histidine kinase CusS
MVENMLFLARAENARLALKLESIELRGELQRIADYFEGIAAEAGIRLVVEGDGTVTADAELLRRAVSNLVANAIRHAPSGGTVTMEITAGPNDMSISVHNPGPEIAPELQSRLFDRFVRGDGARTDSTSSSGLGLAIVKSIMELHEGSCRLASGVGSGAEFRLHFPRRSLEPSASTARTT